MNFKILQEMQSSQDNPIISHFGSNHDTFRQYCKLSRFQGQQMNQDQMYNQGPFIIVKNAEVNEAEKGTSKKEKKKVYYREKLAGLMSPGEFIKQESNNVSPPQSQQNKAANSKEQQLKRNRESAKNTRQLKKQYISHLQKKNQEQKRAIQELTLKLQHVTQQRDRLKQYNHAQFKNFFISQAKGFQNLQYALKEYTQKEEIDAVLKDVIQKFGTSGSERNALINYYMNEIIEELVSDAHKYFLVSSSFIPNSRHNRLQSIDVQVMRILRLDQSKLNLIFTKYKDRFLKQTTVFKDLTQGLYRIFKSIQAQGRVIELVFAELIKQLEPRALVQLLIWFQQNRFCGQIKRVRNEWTQQLKSGQEVLEVFRKQIKHDKF